MNDLVLHVKKVYFDAIRDGRKSFEYRERTPYWDKRLRGRTYDAVQLHCGYPKAGDSSRIIRRRWKGFFEETIVHNHFGGRLVPVFSINVAEEK
jgi:hypothetical protein